MSLGVRERGWNKGCWRCGQLFYNPLDVLLFFLNKPTVSWHILFSHGFFFNISNEKCGKNLRLVFRILTCYRGSYIDSKSRGLSSFKDYYWGYHLINWLHAAATRQWPMKKRTGPGCTHLFTTGRGLLSARFLLDSSFFCTVRQLSV